MLPDRPFPEASAAEWARGAPGADAMRYVRIVLGILAVSLIAATFDYSLPSTNVVKLVGTEVVRTDVGSLSLFWASPDSGTGTDISNTNRDVRFINAVFSDGSPRVFRNEDTGWGWPPYFKFSSGNLQAEAQSLSESEGWVAVRHYGWRIKMFSIYPNALSLKEVVSPQSGTWNWTRIAAAVLLVIAGLIAWRLWVRIQRWATDLIDRIKSRL